MFVHPDPTVNQALVDTLKHSVRVVTDKVYFDWDRDGNYQSPYTDMSKVLIDLDLERAALQTDMPEQVNTIQGYSSAELTLTLRGNRDSDEPSVNMLLSAFNVNGPFYNKDLVGTPVRHTKVIEIDGHPDVEIRQFTGVIRDIQFSRRGGDVKIIAIDSAPWTTSSATLPLWAVDNVKLGGGRWTATTGRPINAGWVVGELLRQAGTPVGPPERGDCAVSFSGMGSFLHSVGQPLPYTWGIEAEYHRLPLETTTPAWTTGKYGTVLAATQGSGSSRAYGGNEAQTEFPIIVPRNGTSDPQMHVGFSGWIYSDGTANRAIPGIQSYYDGTILTLVLPVNKVSPSVIVNFAKNGQVYAYVIGSSGVGWQWATGNLPQGWHYVDANFTFTNSNISLDVHADDNLVSLYSGSRTQAGGYNDYGSGSLDYRPLRAHLRNRAGIMSYGLGQHFQIYAGTFAEYEPGQGDILLTDDGLPLVDFRGCHAELSWIPDTVNENVWETLQKLATAEFAAMYTNEYGQLVWRPHFDIRNSTSVQAQAFYTVDELAGLVTNPSLDQYRNIIRMAYTDRQQEVDDVWTAPTGLEFPVLYNTGGGHYYSPSWDLTGDVVKIVNSLAVIRGWSDAPGNGRGTNTQQRGRTRLSGVPMANITVDAMDPNHDGSTADAYFTQGGYEQAVFAADQRSFQLYIPTTMLSSSLPGTQGVDKGIYFGASPYVVNAEDNPEDQLPGANFAVRGKKYGDKVVRWHEELDNDQLAQRGGFVLRLEANDWRQTIATAEAIAPQLLADTSVPAPTIEGFEIPSDPRLQLTDIIALTPEGEFSAQIQAQVVGIRRNARRGTDSLDLRITKTPSKWALGVVGASELGVTTYLN